MSCGKDFKHFNELNAVGYPPLDLKNKVKFPPSNFLPPDLKVGIYVGNVTISEGDLDLALQGKKTLTIRKGFKKLDKVNFLSDKKRYLPIKNINLQYCTWGTVNDGHAKAEGFGNRAELEKDMSQYYGELSDDEPMTLIDYEVDQEKIKPFKMQGLTCRKCHRGIYRLSPNNQNKCVCDRCNEMVDSVQPNPLINVDEWKMATAEVCQGEINLLDLPNYLPLKDSGKDYLRLAEYYDHLLCEGELSAQELFDWLVSYC